MSNINEIIKKYMETLSEEEKNNVYISEYAFGYESETQDKLAQLVLKGEKTATSSLYCLYDLENERLPEVNDINVILDSEENEICVTKTTKVYKVPFNEVTEEHAFKEGEGDKSLDYWKNVHKEFFMEESEGKFTEDMEVLCEEFEILK